MAQHDYEILNGSGQAVREDINEALKAILTLNAGGSEPSTDGEGVDTPIAYMVWVDTQPSPDVLKIRNSNNSDWITLCEIASRGVGTIASGSVCIGDGTLAKPGLAFKDDANLGLRRNEADTLSIVTGGADRLTVDSNGKVGIGVTDENGSFAGNVNANLHVQDSPNATIQITSGTSGSSTLKLGDTGDANIGRIQYDNNTDTLAIDTNNNTRLTILSDGKCGIGETTPTELLHVAGNIKTTGSIDIASGNIVNGTPALGSSGYDLQNDGVHKFARATNPSNSVLKVLGADANDNGGELRVKGDGDCENTNGNYDPISSDERLKENIVDASSQWEDIKGIRFRSFNYISKPDTRMLGCVAQELQQVCPSLIKTRPASEEEIADNSNTISQGDQVLSFKQIPLLLKSAKALQEAMERIETLEAKVAALEAGS